MYTPDVVVNPVYIDSLVLSLYFVVYSKKDFMHFN